MAHVESFARSDGGRIEIALTIPDDGDFHIDGSPVALAARREAVMPGRWAVVRQVHSATVVDADRTMLVPEADGIVTDRPDQPIAVQGADCAPLVFVTESGPIGVAHVGWRGLAAGMIEEMTRVLDDGGGRVTRVVVGSCIGPECYEFGAEELATLERKYGESVRGTTSTGALALDLRGGITSACSHAGIPEVRMLGGCTACQDSGFSYRARGDMGRHALVARITS